MDGILIKKENMRVKVHAETWEEAVTQAGAVLEEAGSITHQYVADMIAAVKQFGPYIAIMPGFALAHAAPSPAVKREDLSLITLDAPVSFGSPNDPIHTVLCLAAVDREAHVEALSRVAMALDSEEIFRRMARAQTTDELFDVLHHR